MLSVENMFLWGVEFVFLVDIIIQFFLQKKDEEGKILKQSLQQISENYLRGNFMMDVIIFLPLGWVATILINEKLRVIWYLKVIRMKNLQIIFNERFF